VKTTRNISLNVKFQGTARPAPDWIHMVRTRLSIGNVSRVQNP